MAHGANERERSVGLGTSTLEAVKVSKTGNAPEGQGSWGLHSRRQKLFCCCLSVLFLQQMQGVENLLKCIDGSRRGPLLYPGELSSHWTSAALDHALLHLTHIPLVCFKRLAVYYLPLTWWPEHFRGEAGSNTIWVKYAQNLGPLLWGHVP